MHAVIEEICRIRTGETVRENVLRRWQQVLRSEVQPILDEVDDLRVRVAELEKGKKKAGAAA